MDIITHLALGAIVGEAILGKKVGKQALAIGAVAQFLPDIDVVASLWLTPADNLLAHRGITHSILFIPLAGIILALLANQFNKGKNIPFHHWLVFFIAQLAIHDFVDAFNAYGVGWFEPFNSIRITFNTIYVADPLFSLWLIIAAIALIVIRQTSAIKKYWVMASLMISSMYLVYSLYNKYTINNEVNDLLTKQHVIHQRYFTTPTPFNTWLWFVVAQDDHGYHIGYRSVFDTSPVLKLEYFPRQDTLLKNANPHELQQLIKFSDGYYIIEKQNGITIFNNLRFGQINGWKNPHAPFAFHYYMNNPEENLMVMQRGRFSGWDKETTTSLITRIKGN